jgi:PD-(D/E)XK nuclease superfamily
MKREELVHEIHSSEIRAFLECRRYWNWAYRDRWAPNKTPAPLEFGKAWHAALEAVYDPELWESSTKEDMYNRGLAALTATMRRQTTEYLKRIGKYVLDLQDAEEYQERITLGKNMLFNLVRNLDKSKYRPIATEQEYLVPLLDVDGLQLYCHCQACFEKLTAYIEKHNATPGDWYQGLPVVFGCRIDVVLEDKMGSLWLGEHKSAANLLAPEGIQELSRDLQVNSYLWAVNHDGRRVCGVLYNQFRKSYPKPPKRLVNASDGRQFSTNRLQLTDYYTAVRVFKTDKWAWERGLYTEYLDWLREEGKKDFFRQFAVFRTDEQIELAGRRLTQYAIAMLGDPDIYPNTSVRFICDRCRFSQPCQDLFDGQSAQGTLEGGYEQQELLWYEAERLERSKS